MKLGPTCTFYIIVYHIYKTFHLFLHQKRSQSKDAKSTTYTPPEIFCTEDYLPSHTSTKESSAKSQVVKEVKAAESKGDNSGESSQPDPSSGTIASQ